jgi:hypothetical protein
LLVPFKDEALTMWPVNRQKVGNVRNKDPRWQNLTHSRRYLGVNDGSAPAVGCERSFCLRALVLSEALSKELLCTADSIHALGLLAGPIEAARLLERRLC